MTQLVVRVPSQSSTSVKINSQNQQKVRTLAPVSATSLVGLSDVLVVSSVNNAALVYNSDTSTYEIKPIPVIFGGTF